MMSIIRYKYKADRDFESVQFEGMSCSLRELKRLIVEKSSRSGTHHPRDDYDLIISNSTTYEEYKDGSDLIPRNASVVVARRIRGTFESLTPSSTQKSIVSSDDIVNEYLRPAIFHPTHVGTSSTTNISSSSSPVVDNKISPSEVLTQLSNNTSTTEMSEDERIKEVVKTSQSRYLPSHRSNASYTCHNCKQPGHIRNHCPRLLQSSSTNSSGNGIGSSASFSVDHTPKTDSTQSTGSGSISQSTSHVVTHQSPYQLSYHHHQHHYPHHGSRPHHRGLGYTRNEPLPKRTTGIPRDGLIQIPRHIPGAFRDQSGSSVVPRQMAQLFIEKSEKKADALAQRARQFQEKGVLPPAPPPSMLPTKSTDEETPPDDLLCLICKQIYNDAVIAPCCHNSFCDECIRTALVESEDHECPQCHRQHVAIDQINPNIFLRKHVNRWREERLQKSSYSYMSASQSSATGNYLSSQILEQDLDSTSPQTSALMNTPNLNDFDEYDAAILPTILQQSIGAIKTAPIVIKMQSLRQSQSPQSIVSTKPADMTFEDGKAPDTDQIASSQKDVHSELSVVIANANEEISKAVTDTSVLDYEKSHRQTPPSQVAPVSTILSSPPTTTTTTRAMSATPSIVPHYYATPSHILPHQHHGGIYPQQIPPTSSTSFYPIQPSFYPPPVHQPYLGLHHHGGAPSVLPAGGLYHYPSHPAFSPGPPPHHHHHHHHSGGLPHVQPDPLSGFHVTHYETANVSSLHHPNTAFAATSTSTLIAHHHQTAAQPISTSLGTTLSKNEFYMKQRDIQRIKRSTSRHRSHSRSLSSSSYTSSGSRNSSFSRRDDHRRRRRRSLHSQSRPQVIVRHRGDGRTTSPNRDNYRQKQRSPIKHRSPVYRTRPRTSPIKNNHSSKYQRPSPRSYRSTRDRERRRSPRPPPTLQQSTQRTIVYMHESSSSKHHSHRNRDHHRTKSRSRHRSYVKDDRTAPSSKTEQQSQSESVRSSSPMTVPSDRRHKTLASKIEPVIEEKIAPPILLNSSTTVRSIEINPMTQVNNTTEETNLNTDKKRKKHHHQHHHHKKHRRHRSKSKKRHHSKDNETKMIVDDTTTMIEVQP